MAKQDNDEFKFAVREIAIKAPDLNNAYDVTVNMSSTKNVDLVSLFSTFQENINPFWNVSGEYFKFRITVVFVDTKELDRVRCAQWVKKLSQIPDEDLELARIRNEYAQLLRIQVRHDYIHSIFKTIPPESLNLAPLAENLGNVITKKIPLLPRVGPIAPVIQHRSPDGRAYVAAKQMEGGVFCYMAVTPDTFK